MDDYGFHGTTLDKANNVLLNFSFKDIEVNSSLGKGLYFFIDADKEKAFQSAYKYPFDINRHCYDVPAVLRADFSIDDNHILNLNSDDMKLLLDSAKQAVKNRALLTSAKDDLEDDTALEGFATDTLCNLFKKVAVIKTVPKPDLSSRLVSRKFMQEDVFCICIKNPENIIKKSLQIIKGGRTI